MWPLGDRVLIKPDPVQDNINGIYIPDIAKEQPQRGMVIATAKGCVGSGFRPGDNVLFGKYSGTEVSVDGELHLLMNYKDVLMKIEKAIDKA